MIEIPKIQRKNEKKKNFFPLSREKNSFSKSPYSKNFAEKIEIFPKFCFIEKLWTFLRRMSPLATLYDKNTQFW